MIPKTYTIRSQRLKKLYQIRILSDQIRTLSGHRSFAPQIQSRTEYVNGSGDSPMPSSSSGSPRWVYSRPSSFLSLRFSFSVTLVPTCALINKILFQLREYACFQIFFYDPVSSWMLLQSVFNRDKKKRCIMYCKKNEGKIRCDVRAFNRFCLNQTIIRGKVLFTVSWAHHAVTL
jgi:hypothetical protein